MPISERRIMKFLTMILIVVNLMWGAVDANTLHESDALKLQVMLMAYGFEGLDFDVYISDYSGGTSFFVEWGIEWGDPHFPQGMYDGGVECLYLSIASVGKLTLETNWSSNLVCVIFSDYVITMTTSDARWVIENLGDLPETHRHQWYVSHINFYSVQDFWQLYFDSEL